jgi:4-hydroxybenzoate polyprenyltransferase
MATWIGGLGESVGAIPTRRPGAAASAELRYDNARQLPLCVDLDGTLVLSDLLLESLLRLIRTQPLCLLLIPVWLLRGRAAFKAEVAARVRLNPRTLPYHAQLIEWLQTERQSGRELWLCTAANESVAAGIVAHLNIFAGVLASTSTVNLAGRHKAACLEERFGYQGFDYCGNERRDIHIWKRSRGAIVVSRRNRLARRVARHAVVVKSFSVALSPLQAALREMRPHQWAKNLLVLVPLLASHRIADPDSLLPALLAVAAFCLCASSVYVLNDLLDLDADRAHSTKSARPLAAGDLPILAGLALVPLLLGASLALSLLLPVEFRVALAGYYGLTVLYSFCLKGHALVDVLALAALYTLRIIAGAMAIVVQPSFWLMWFSMFLFLSLAFVKRFAELHALKRRKRKHTAGRDYIVDDLWMLQSLGTAAGYLSVLVLALYVRAPEVAILYARPAWIWLLCVLLLYWIGYVWMKAQRGEMHDDPVVFALKDRTSLVVGVLAAITISLAM